jgi:small subunit ribosomal protein S8
MGAMEIPKVLGGYGINIVSTSRGLMSGKRARRENVGGEVLAQIY